MASTSTHNPGPFKRLFIFKTKALLISSVEWTNQYGLIPTPWTPTNRSYRAPTAGLQLLPVTTDSDQAEAHKAPESKLKQDDGPKDLIISSADRLRVVLEKLGDLNVTKNVQIAEQIASAGGGFCDVYIGYALRGSDRIKVAVRKLRAFIILNHDFRKVCVCIVFDT